MAIKSFNVEEETYKKFSSFCKERGMSMSKQIEFFMKSTIEEGKIKEEYLKKLALLRAEEPIHVGSLASFKKKYGLK